MRVNAWNVYNIVRENARIVAATDHTEATTVTEALDAAEDLARAWNVDESRPDMLVTMLSCNGIVRSIPVQGSLL